MEINKLLEEIEIEEKRNAVFAKIDPDVLQHLSKHGWELWI